MMDEKEKLKMLQEILKTDAVQKEPKGILKVTAAGDSPEEAKQKIMEGLKSIHLPGKEDMPKMMGKGNMHGMDEEQSEPSDNPEEEQSEICPECGQPMCPGCDENPMEDSQEPSEEEVMGKENTDILDMVPESQREHIKKMLMEKIKNM